MQLHELTKGAAKRRTVSVRMPPSMMRWVEAAANRELRSLNAQMLKFIEHYMEEAKTPHA
jgi:hypothetical protein